MRWIEHFITLPLRTLNQNISAKVLNPPWEDDDADLEDDDKFKRLPFNMTHFLKR
jgi:hypothetical protein